MRKLWNKTKLFFKGLWAVIKSMGNWKGVSSLLIVWIILSGVGLAIVGFIVKNKWLIGVGVSIFTFWAGPFTPLIPITIAIAMVVQRYIFRDKNVSIKMIREKFKEVKEKDK